MTLMEAISAVVISTPTQGWRAWAGPLQRPHRLNADPMIRLVADLRLRQPATYAGLVRAWQARRLPAYRVQVVRPLQVDDTLRNELRAAFHESQT